MPEQRGNALEQQGAAGDTRRGCRGRAQEAVATAGSTAAEQAGRGRRLRVARLCVAARGRRVLRRRRRWLLDARPRPAAGRNGRRGRRARLAAAEQAAEEARRLLLRWVETRRLLLEFSDAILRIVQRQILNKHRLHEIVGRVRHLGHRLADHRIRLRVLRLSDGALQAGQQRGDQIAFLGFHGVLPVGSGAFSQSPLALPIAARRARCGEPYKRVNEAPLRVSQSVWSQFTRRRGAADGSALGSRRAYASSLVTSQRIVPGGRLSGWPFATGV